jgi:hypothetical protein
LIFTKKNNKIGKMSNTQTVEKTITIPETEYERLKNLDERFNEFVEYMEHIRDIKEAREEIKQGKGIPQEEVFKELEL